MAEIKWIKCSDRLPEKDGNYLTIHQDKDMLYCIVEDYYVADEQGGWNCSRSVVDEKIYNESRIETVAMWADIKELYAEAERMVKE